MAIVFLSHSSRDKEFVRRLDRLLQEVGHQVWLDERDIAVGDSIVKKVQDGILKADFLVVVLSPNSVPSGWVEREWAPRFVKDVKERRATILPVLLAPCPIPHLLSETKYADFTQDFSVGLSELLGAMKNSAGTEIIGTGTMGPRPVPTTGAAPAVAEADFWAVEIGRHVQGSVEKSFDRGDLEALRLGPFLRIFTTVRKYEGHVTFVRFDRDSGRFVPDPNARDGIRMQGIDGSCEHVPIGAIKGVENALPEVAVRSDRYRGSRRTR